MPVVACFKLQFGQQAAGSCTAFTHNVKFTDPGRSIRFQPRKGFDGVNRMRFSQIQITRLAGILPAFKIVQTPANMIVTFLQAAVEGRRPEFRIPSITATGNEKYCKKGFQQTFCRN
ncbi:uncharacterized protein METZ01_LOCUS344702, partial [marine metagenome]